MDKQYDQYSGFNNFRTGDAAGYPAVSPGDIVWFDEELVPFENARVNFLDPSVQNGPGVFEHIYCYNTPRGPAAFRLAEYLERFLRRIRLLGLADFRYGADQLRDIVCRVIQVNRFSECHVQPALFFEDAAGSEFAGFHPVLGIAAWDLMTARTRAAPEKGLKLMASDDNWADTAGENMLLVNDNLISAAPQVNAFADITRISVMALAQDAGFDVSEAPISQEQLFASDEVFVCGAAAELLPVAEINSHPIGSGSAGPVTRKLQGLMAETINGRTRRSAEWLDYMVLEPII